MPSKLLCFYAPVETYDALRRFIESELTNAGGDGWVSYKQLKTHAQREFPTAKFDTDLRSALQELNTERTGLSGEEQYRLHRD